MRLLAINGIIRNSAVFVTLVRYVPMVIHYITQTEIDITGNMAQYGFVKLEIVIVHRVLVLNIGVAAEAEGALRVFIHTIIPYKVVVVIFAPDVRQDGQGNLFVFGNGRAGAYG